ncbi:MAG: hypothetical protein JXA74_00605 [Anaerolineae bacterium]|nr:hypothetical protein [Anaerolineae bacterium]
MKANRWIVPLVTLALLFGSVGLAKALGWWQTTGAKLSTVGDVTPDDIRGSSSLADLSVAFDIPTSEIFSILGIPDTFPPETQLKDLETYNEVGTVRGLIAEHLGLPWEWDEEHAPITDQGEAAADAGVTPTPAEEHTGPTPLPAGSTLPAAEIKGRMTLREVSQGTGMPLDELYAALNLPRELDADTALRDISAQVAGFETSVVREVVEAYQAELGR